MPRQDDEVCHRQNPLGETLTPAREAAAPTTPPAAAPAAEVEAEVTVAFLLRRRKPAGPEANLGTALCSRSRVGTLLRPAAMPESSGDTSVLGLFWAPFG